MKQLLIIGALGAAGYIIYQKLKPVINAKQKVSGLLSGTAQEENISAVRRLSQQELGRLCNQWLLAKN